MTDELRAPRQTLAQAVLAQMRRTPASVALVDGDRSLSGAGLDRASGAVATALRAAGVRPGQAVAVCLPRSWQLVCVMLGILRAGAVVVPLDAQSPTGRQRHILEDSGSVMLVHDGQAREGLPDPVLQISATTLLTVGETDPVDEPEPAAANPSFSFLFYTSGTTGRPKGVEVRDAGILRLARPGYIELNDGARYACLSNPAFDAMSFEVWVPLLTGGCCVILGDQAVQTPELLAATLLRERIDTLWVTAALFNAVTDKVPDCFAGARQVLVGGEQLNARLISRWYRHNADSGTTLYNGYGPTETATFALSHRIPRDFDGDVVPIGRPLPDTGVLLVAEGSRPAVPGEPAELHLSGDGLAAGYRNLPEETERRFVRVPWADDGSTRYYRTGDLVRQGEDGLISYVGRVDRQVKVRGFRIEPGELERQIVAHPAVRQAYVCTRRDTEQGVNELLAYLVLGAEVSFDEFDRHLAAGLPPYMRPHRIHVVDALPLNANGKVDQNVLLRGGHAPWRREGGATAPAATAWQRELLDLAGHILGVPDLRPDDRWIPNGGDSLKALRLRFEVRRRWNSELSQAQVLRADFAELADEIESGRATQGSPYPPVPAPSGDTRAPATSEQQRLWLLQQRDPLSRAYDVPLAFRLDGAPDTATLRVALRQAVARHPALRTAFRATPDGLLQEVAAPYDPWTALPGEDGNGNEDGDGTRSEGPDHQGENGWRHAARRFFATPFDLSEPRMLRACWLPEDGVLLLHLHHIAVDGWSLNLLFRDLSADCAPPPDAQASVAQLPLALPPGVQPSAALPPATVRDDTAPTTALDYAHWQTDWRTRQPYLDQRAELRAHYDLFTETAAPLPPMTAPEPGVSDGRERAPGRLLHTTLDAAHRASIDRLCAEFGLTRFQLLLGVYAWSLYGVTGRTRPVIAGPVANRPVQEFASGVGMFANTVLVPLESEPDEELRTQLLRQGAAAQSVLDRQDVLLADALADHPFRADGPQFDFMFVLENTEFDTLVLPGCEVHPLWPEPAEAKCPLTLSVVERGTGFDCLWEYADGPVDSDAVDAVARLFREGLDRLAQGGTVTLAELVSPYRRGLADPGHGAPTAPEFTTVAEGFARQARLTPAAPAVTSGGRTLSYAELDAHAAALATELEDRYPLAPDDTDPRCVALHLGPSIEHVVALLALARLNITIVPLDPAYPPSLLRHILDRVDPLCVLLAPDGEDALVPPAVPRHPVVLASRPAPAALRAPHDARRPLYTLFTSGSTGAPKGVQVPDLTLCNLLQWQQDSGGLERPAVTQQFSMLSFDVSFQEIFTTLLSGGRLHLVRPEWRQDVPALLEQLETVGAERIFMPYVALQFLAEHGTRLGRHPSRLREVITAGEQLVVTDAIRGWFAGLPGARLFNHYGPTETHVVSGLCLEGDPARWPERPAIGRPVAGARLRVVDAGGLPVPPGCPGDLLIGGPMAAPCYLGDEELNRTRFVETPADGLFYRSGDQARFDRDGLLHYLGRDDQQVKVSGHRLELGQVEAALLRHPAIVNAVVVLDGSALVACLQCHGEPPTRAELSSHLAELLPPHARVHRFRLVRELPRTPSGKLDRRAAPTCPGEELRDHEGPERRLSPREALLTDLFEAVTGKSVTPEQRFFDAGATSLDLMRFHLRCTAEPDLRFTVPDLFEHVTVRALARFLDGRTGPEAAARPERGSRPEQAHGSDPAAGPADEPIAVIGMAVRLPGADDLGAFWDLIRSGGVGIEHFDAPAGMVGARSQLSGLLGFDPEHFGISRQEARLMDPQQRHLLMSCVEALAHAGIADPGGRTEQRTGQRVGLIAGCGENTYFQAMLKEADPAQLPDRFQLALHHDKDFLTTKVAYHLGLTGPAFTVQAACASSLVGVHVAAGLLRQGDADVMLAGGVLVDTQLSGGYRYRPQHIYSKDGYCRPFSDDASGTIGASGVGVVVLKPLRLARRDGDTVYAVITGSALNNDGAEKQSYSSPSLSGQREVIRAALRRSGRTSAELGYVEAHGTATRLGDPVEIGALRQAFELDEADHCALSSVKSQIGHLGAAAGVVGLVRAALAVHHGVIPPNVGFRGINPQIGTDLAPFHIPAGAQPWPADRPRVAAVSSFGIGGTNAHLVLEEADGPRRTPPGSRPSPLPCLVLSSSSAAGLRADAARIADHLAARPETFEEVLRHLQAGRPAHRRRAATVVTDAVSAVAWLRTVAGAAADDVQPTGRTLTAADHDADVLATAWEAGDEVSWPDGPAQAPWDFPPPAFDRADYDFVRRPDLRGAPAAAVNGAPGKEVLTSPSSSTPVPAASVAASVERLPEEDWLHQTTWARLRRATREPAPASGRTLVAMTATPSSPDTWRPFERTHARVVRVSAADGFARRSDDLYELDPADPEALARLLDALADGRHSGVDWLHALPLSTAGPVDEQTLDHARWACLDTTAALLRAAAGSTDPRDLRVWWLSDGAQPVGGPVRRPESGLLAGPVEVARQETGLPGRWLDLPSSDPDDWAALLPSLLSDDGGATDNLPSRLALRDGFWWHPTVQPVRPPAPRTDPPPPTGTHGAHLVLGGTGGIGAGVAAWLLEQDDACRVVLLARRPLLPGNLARWADRVTLVAGDLAAETPDALLTRLAPHLHDLQGIVHAAGTAAGGLIIHRDAAAMRLATASKLRGALLAELLTERHQPAYVAYCSSMATLFGGIGQFDYAAANGLLDGFAGHRAGPDETTVRIGIDWDVWSEVGMARETLHSDVRHQAHLAVGLSVEEALRQFGHALRLQLPQLMVCTTALDDARTFYAPATSSVPPDRPGTTARTAEATAPSAAPEAGQLADIVCRLLGLDTLDPDASLYDLGADSLTLLDLIAEVEQLYGQELELFQLSHRVSVNDVMALLEHPAEAARPGRADGGPVAVEVWQEGAGRDLLCLVHPVGGDIQAYRELVSALDPQVTVCLIADPGLYRPELPDWSVGERAARYLAAVEARFPHSEWRRRFAGWSFGAWVALSMAAEAEAAGRPAARLYLLDPPPPGVGPLLGAYDEEQMQALFTHELGGQGGASAAGEEARTYAERLARRCRANLGSMRDHATPRLTATPSTMWLAGQAVSGLLEPDPPELQAQAWQAQLSGASVWEQVETTHYGIVRSPHVKLVAEAVNADSLPAPTRR